MRIVVAAPPKAGNSWVRCLLGTVYGLDGLSGPETPRRVDTASFKEWVAGGNFRDGTIFHQHYDYSDEFADAVEAVPARLVTIVRDPYDAFVSLYHFVQAPPDEHRSGRERRDKPDRPRANDVMIGKPIDHPDVLQFLERRFRSNLRKANEWLHGGRSVVIRYEDLHRDPVAAVQGLTDQIEPVAPERVQQAVAACEASNMREINPGMARRIRSATVGDWRNHLTAAHLTIFRDRHADLVRGLGYEVQEP